MATPYSQRRKLVDNPQFIEKLQMAVWIAATDVLNEAPGTPNHAARVVWANKQLKGPADPDKMMVIAVRATANNTVGSAGMEALDNDIQFVVNGLVDILA